MSELVRAEKFYRQGLDPAHDAIKAFLKDSPMIVHGARAINAYLPEWLDKETRDWDIFAEDRAEELANELEKKLDAHYGGDYFSVEPALHPGTYKVKSKITGDTIADITLRDRRVSFNTIKGINYATLEYHERKIRETLTDPTRAFRHRKDKDTLQRIKIYKKLKKQSAVNGKGSLRGIRV